MKLFWLCALVGAVLLFSAACAPAASVQTTDVVAGATFAAQTAVAAGNSANVLGVLAVQTGIAKTETASDLATANAQERFRLSVTQTAETNQTRGAQEESTAHAVAQSTAWSRNATYAAQTPTARAIQTVTAVAASIATQTAIPQQTRDAIALESQIARNNDDLAMLRASQGGREAGSWVAELIKVTWIPVGGVILLLILLFGLRALFDAYIEAKRAESHSKLPAPIPLTDSRGVVYVVLVPTPQGWQQQTVDAEWQVVDEPVPQIAPPIVVNSVNQPTAPPDPELVYGFITRVALESFVTEILRTGDWTQPTWADKVVPLGAPANAKVAFVLSKNTEDERGNPVWGGYARVMELFVAKRLILGRRTGATGKWNPNAPITVGEVMAILCNKAPLPSIPPPAPTTSPARRRKRPVAPALSGAGVEKTAA